MTCRSILNKIDKVLFIFGSIDILSCSETWLNEQIPDHMIAIPGMDLYRWDRDNGAANEAVKKREGGGIACYVNKKLGLDCQLIPNLSKTSEDIEVMTLYCKYSFGKKLYLMSIYRPPNGNGDSFFTFLTDNIFDNSLLDNELWILGDLNIDFLKRDDLCTKKLLECLRLTGLSQHIRTLTRLTGLT